MAEALAQSDAWRSAHLGASDAPIILGLSPWGSPLEVWARKTGRIGKLEDETGRLEVGTRLEPVILQWYSELSGLTVVAWDQNDPRQLAGSPISATPDAYLVTHGPLHLVECKTASEFMRGEWVEGPPIYYKTQVQIQMLCTGASRCDVVVMVGFSRPQWWTVEADPELQQLLRALLEEWWEAYVVADEPPRAVASDGLGLLARLHPNDDGVIIDVGPEWVGVVEEWEQLAAAEKEAEAGRLELKTKIQETIGDHTGIRLPDGRGWTWRRGKRGRTLLMKERV